MLPLKQKVESIINSLLEDTPYEMLQLVLNTLPSGFEISITIDYKNREQNISIGDCTVVTKKIQLHFEQEELFADRFFVNVESPGIDRLLLNKKDFEKNQGLDVKFKLLKALDNTFSLKAEIIKVLENSIVVSYKDLQHEVPFADIESAKVVFNDKLIKKLNIFKKK